MAPICHKHHLPSVWTQEEDKFLKEGFGGIFGWFIYFWRTNQFIPYFQRFLEGFSCGTPDD